MRFSQGGYDADYVWRWDADKAQIMEEGSFHQWAFTKYSIWAEHCANVGGEVRQERGMPSDPMEVRILWGKTCLNK